MTTISNRSNCEKTLTRKANRSKQQWQATLWLHFRFWIKSNRLMTVVTLMHESVIKILQKQIDPCFP